MHEYVERCDGDVRRTLIRLSTEIGDKDPVAKSQDMMIRLSLALDGQVSGEQLEAAGGPRFVVRAGGVVLGSSDVQRQAGRQYRIRTKAQGEGSG
ncbi:hypothetical protein ABZY83_07720 [Streptomyces virginiae]|uniref:hypothetical protein n=1 Tax=Streptomyces TaxID=1883 RepID=UPI00131BF2AA|nr:hypothetical protein [Streptomyces sp. H021]